LETHLKIKCIVKAMALLAVCASTAGVAHAGPLSLQNAIITATYNGDAAGMLGLDHLFALEAGSNTSGLDPTNSGVEFLTSDFLFGIDFSPTGSVTVIANAPVAAGAYSMRFDFGSSLASTIGGFTLVGANGVTGVPGLSIVDSHTIALDLGAVDWTEFGSVTAEISAVAAVPEPASGALLLAGLGSLAAVRRLRRS
jgi:hypothetical protein